MNPTRLLLASLLFVVSASALVAGETPGKQIVIEMLLVEIPRPKTDEPRGQHVEPLRRVVGDAAAIRGLLKLVGERDDAKTLAAPTILTTDGQQATVHSGGELPVPVRQPNGQWTTETRTFGTILKLDPKTTDEGVVLDVDARVVERDFENAVEINGQTVPRLVTRSLRTTVTLPRGQGTLLVAEHPDATRMLFVHPEEVVTPPAK